ncbi:MAG: M13 family metallopeptidase [Verrucomicrobiota bacterium]|nr:M13 family metallopeptidase [Verrucomicrobiota bacterium]
MIKSSVLLLGLVLSGSLFAQTEPQKSPPTQAPPPPAAVHDGHKNPTAQAPPTGSSATNPGAATDSAQPQIDKNPPPLDPKNLDTSVNPSDDFYLFANGGWIKRNPIPPEFARWGSFNELTEKNNDSLHEIAEKAAAAAPKEAGKNNVEKAASSDLQKVGDFYASGMNEAAVEAAKGTPLTDEMKRIDAIKDRKELEAEIAHLHSMGIPAFFGFTSGQDDKNSTMVIAQAYQGGLGLPDRDYYTKDDDASKKLRDQYVQHVTKMLTLLGDQAAADHANKILAFETSLAKPARTRVELRDPQKNYNKMKQAELQALMPDWNWADYFKGIALVEPGDINVGQPDFFKAANEVFKTAPIDDWKTYLRWQLLHAAAPALSSDFVNENFAFFSKALTGAQQLKPRWKRVVTATDGVLGEALGKLYVSDHFPPEAKARALEMVNNLKEALAERIKSRDWMDEPTKQEALKKLAAFTVKIGYPDKWRDYSTLMIDRGPYALNLLRGEKFETDRELKKIGKPVDRSEWGMTPPTVNAYYNPNMNEIVFPAGILQPPFFDVKADDAVNYGGMGAVIGHEMTHGFDDQGRQYDGQGNLREWWSEASKKAYDERRQAVVAQYAAYEPLPGIHINGELTQGENIADIGGIKLAYTAMQKALAKHPEASQQKIDGFTPDQRFFLGFAQIWRNNQRDEDLKLRLNTDPHSPGRFRTIGPLSNMDEFAKAFNLPANSPMIRPPDQRVNIW